jgi:hypothetical protein
MICFMIRLAEMFEFNNQMTVLLDRESTRQRWCSRAKAFWYEKTQSNNCFTTIPWIEWRLSHRIWCRIWVAWQILRIWSQVSDFVCWETRLGHGKPCETTIMMRRTELFGVSLRIERNRDYYCMITVCNVVPIRVRQTIRARVGLV